MVFCLCSKQPSFGKLSIPKPQSVTSERRTSFFGARYVNNCLETFKIACFMCFKTKFVILLYPVFNKINISDFCGMLIFFYRMSGASMPRNSTMSGFGGTEKIKDARPLHDKSYVQQCIRQLHEVRTLYYTLQCIITCGYSYKC